MMNILYLVVYRISFAASVDIRPRRCLIQQYLPISAWLFITDPSTGMTYNNYEDILHS